MRYDPKKPKNNKDFEEAIIISKAMNKKKEPEEKKRSKFDIFLDYMFCRFGI